MRSSKMIFVLLFLSALSSAQILMTNLGEMRGYERISRDGRSYMSYTGIPYAKPPVGKLRFKNPEPVGPWKGELDATKPIPMCAQTNLFFRLPGQKEEVNGQEDCLYLNIYVPKVAAGLPVLLHIHGGGFKIGYPGPNEMADYFMDEDVVLVTVTYRLSAFGFLSTEDDVVTGNFGLKDQAMAIKWVHENIKSFGGDPHLITVFGESAGGGSAHFHLYSPLSRDMVKGAISESGTVNRVWTLAPSGLMKSRTMKLAENLDCPQEPQKLLECLQNVDFKTLTLLADNLFHFWDMDDVIPWRPVLEKSAPGAFVVEDPLKTSISKPWMSGCTIGEGLFRTSTLRIKPKEVVDELARKYVEITSLPLNMDPDDPKNRNTLDLIHKRFYKSNESEDLIRGYEKFFSETFFVYPLQENALRHQGPLYMYRMEYRGEGTLLDFIYQFNHTRPDHIDETFLLFNYKERYGLQGTLSDIKLSKEVVKLWVNFAKFQNPSPNGSNVEWPEYGKGKKLLRITSQGLIVGEDEWGDIYDFWHGIF